MRKSFRRVYDVETKRFAINTANNNNNNNTMIKSAFYSCLLTLNSINVIRNKVLERFFFM